MRRIWSQNKVEGLEFLRTLISFDMFPSWSMTDVEILFDELENDDNFLIWVFFNDKETFQTNGCVNRHNCRISKSEQQNVIPNYFCDSPKRDGGCGILGDQFYGLLFFVVKLQWSYNWICYSYSFLPDRTTRTRNWCPCNFHVRWSTSSFQKRNVQTHWISWIGRSGANSWLTRNQNLTPIDFFMDTLKTLCKLKNSCQVDLWKRISAIATIPPNMLQHMRQKIENRCYVFLRVALLITLG